MKLQYDEPLSNVAFSFNLRRYMVALLVFAYAYYAYRHEAINGLMQAIAERAAFQTHEFEKLYKGMNVDPLNEAVLASAESIHRSGYRLVCGVGGDPDEQEAAWSYTHDKLLPIHVVWQARVTYRVAFRRYAAELAANATAIASRDKTPPALTFKKFDETLLAMFGPFHSFVPAAEKHAAFRAFAVMPSAELAQKQLTREQFPAAVVEPR